MHNSVILLHVYDLRERSGLPVLIRRTSNPEEDAEPMDIELASKISSGPVSVGQGELQGARTERGGRKDAVDCDERGNGGRTDVQSTYPTLGT